MKLEFYHLTSYTDNCKLLQKRIVDIMNVENDDWVAVTYENNWFPGIAFNVQSINSSHSILSIIIFTYLMGIDPSFKLVRKGEWKFAQVVEDGGGNGLN